MIIILFHDPLTFQASSSSALVLSDLAIVSSKLTIDLLYTVRVFYVVAADYFERRVCQKSNNIEFWSIQRETNDRAKVKFSEMI
ncbi:unnamed protein product, partial [Heterotrigona itama]